MTKMQDLTTSRVEEENRGLHQEVARLTELHAVLRELLAASYYEVSDSYHQAICSNDTLMCDYYGDLIARIDAALGEEP